MIKTTILLDTINFTYEGGITPIFTNLTLHVDSSWKLGIIGRNGRGKTTLLNILAGKLRPQSGKVRLPEHVSLFPVNVPSPEESVLNVVKDLIGPIRHLEKALNQAVEDTSEAGIAHYGDLLEQFENLRGYTIESLIEKEFRLLGMEPSLLDQSFMALSGGEKTKAQIAALFLRPQNYLLIDEPTNHLDIKGRAELATYLKGKRGFAVVSHDQALIDDCCDHILEISQQGVHVEKGNYSSWDTNKRQRDAAELHKKEKLEKEVQQLEKASRQAMVFSYSKEKEKIGSYDKGFIGARAARLMKRAKSLENRKQQKLDEARSLLKEYERVRTLELKQTKLATETYVKFQNISFAYNHHPVLRDLNFEVRRGERIWLRGGNGSGKSTLLKLLSKELQIQSGYESRAINLRTAIAYQDMPVTCGTVGEYVTMYQTDLTAFIRMLDYFNMPADYVERRIETLSDGERKKLDLARVFSSDAPLYIWDEPLNYMDYHFRIQLEEAVIKYKPTVVFVEHDRLFGEKVATRVLDFKNGLSSR